MVKIPRTLDFTATAAEGCVSLGGPGVVCSMQPETALYVADLLLHAAVDAVGQRKTAQIARGLTRPDQAQNSGPSSSG
jgi:hypothetical protein